HLTSPGHPPYRDPGSLLAVHSRWSLDSGSMLKQIVVALIILAVLAVVAVLKQRIAAPVKIGAYYLRKSLFTAAERSFLGVLEPMLPSEVRVFAKVRLADIFGVVSGLERGARQG